MSDLFLLAKKEASYKELFSKHSADAQAADGCISSRQMHKQPTDVQEPKPLLFRQVKCRVLPGFT
jgi:hypothetical protein